MCERDVRKPWVSRLARGVHIINKRVLKVTHVKHILEKILSARVRQVGQGGKTRLTCSPMFLIPAVARRSWIACCHDTRLGRCQPRGRRAL